MSTTSASSGRVTRRRLLGGLAAGGLLAGFDALLPAWAGPLAGAVRSRAPGPVEFDLTVARQRIDIAGKSAFAHTLNGTVPGPLIELYEGHEARLRVRNALDEDTSIHWHGILLPYEMDGVPGVSFPGIRPGETFEARFRVRQAGTYWYHSHSGLQEQTGVYGPLVIHPAGGYADAFDRDYVVLLSDWTFEDPFAVLARLKKVSHYYNFQEQTLPQVAREGAWRQWLAWQQMRMSPADIADVTGYTYTYLMNGLHSAGNWTGLFTPGERVRLRIINASAMTYFNLRIPGLPMTVVQADGLDVQPVETDELQIAVAETYDVIVTPQDSAYTVFAESMDRSGFAAGTLAPRVGLTAAVPALRKRPLRTMTDMGMDHAAMGHDAGAQSPAADSHADHAGHAGHVDHSAGDLTAPDPHAGHAMASPPLIDHAAMGAAPGPRSARTGIERAAPGPLRATHNADTHGVGNQAVAHTQRDRTAEPGTGLADVDHRVLVYADLLARTPSRDTRPPARDIELHLTGHMERYMWSFDGKKFSEVQGPILFHHGERLRLTLVNDTMMEHPIHLHGMFFEVDNGAGAYRPRKHTVSVRPAERLRLLVTADEPGRWAFHCHLLYHMHMGMMRVVEVV